MGHGLAVPGPHRARIQSRIAWLALSLLLAACSRSPQAGAARKVQLSPCRLEGVARQALCGTWTVLENRAEPKGRRIPLRVVVLPALAAAPEPDPLVLLAGGPGQAASEAARSVVPAIEPLLRTRDLVLVDQRGTGQSHPLDCETLPRDAGLSVHFEDVMVPGLLERCLKALDADPKAYTTPVAMEDLEEVRAALGYERINLWGISYGTRAALVYLRAHPERVRTATLDGVAPMALKLPLSLAQDSQRALTLLFAHCEKDPVCAQTYPNLAARFDALLARMEENPLEQLVTHPLTGRPEPLQLSRAAFVRGLRGLLYLPESASLFPWMIARTEAGDLGPFVAMSLSLEGGMSDQVSLGMFLSVICSEDVPFIQEEELRKQAQGTWVGESLARDMMAACRVWPQGSLPKGYREAVRSDRPVLLLSGELDPVTPPAWGEVARATLSQSLHVVVPSVGHNTLGTACARNVMADFLRQGHVQGLKSHCGRGLSRPPFFTSFAGPPP